MGRKSKIESHPDCKKIITLLASGEEYSKILQDYPTLTWFDLDYYSKNKLPVLVSKSPEFKAEVEEFRGNNTLEEVRSLKEKALEILAQAQQAGDLKTALMGIREARSCLELWMRAEGQLNDAPQITIINNPEWVEIRTLIISALDPFPDAKQAVCEVLR
jgi:hypothetical protein